MTQSKVGFHFKVTSSRFQVDVSRITENVGVNYLPVLIIIIHIYCLIINFV